MKPEHLKTAHYSVCNLKGFTLTEALRFWKTGFETVKHFKRDVIRHPGLEELGRFVEEVWETIVPISVTEALQEQHMEKRRMMFDCIGVSKLFRELEPELLDSRTITKKTVRWDGNNQPYEYCFEDTYELYRIDGEKLFTPLNESRAPNPVYAVRCRCTTTDREYWIYVPETAAIQPWEKGQTGVRYDALMAIAWTIRIDITHPKRIYRQGDIILVEESADSKDCNPYHISKEEYLDLMYSET